MNSGISDVQVKRWGHPLQLSAGRVRTDKRKYFFTQQVVSLWNFLPQDVVMASGLDNFKRGLDRFLEEKSIAGYKNVISR